MTSVQEPKFLMIKIQDPSNHSIFCRLQKIRFTSFVSLRILRRILSSWRVNDKCILKFKFGIQRGRKNMHRDINFSNWNCILCKIRKWSLLRYSFLIIIWYSDQWSFWFKFIGMNCNFQFQSFLSDSHILNFSIILTVRSADATFIKRLCFRLVSVFDGWFGEGKFKSTGWICWELICFADFLQE